MCQETYKAILFTPRTMQRKSQLIEPDDCYKIIFVDETVYKQAYCQHRVGQNNNNITFLSLFPQDLTETYTNHGGCSTVSSNDTPITKSTGTDLIWKWKKYELEITSSKNHTLQLMICSHIAD